MTTQVALENYEQAGSNPPEPELVKVTLNDFNFTIEASETAVRVSSEQDHTLRAD
jgi:hypothetical protein